MPYRFAGVVVLASLSLFSGVAAAFSTTNHHLHHRRSKITPTIITDSPSQQTQLSAIPSRKEFLQSAFLVGGVSSVVVASFPDLALADEQEEDTVVDEKALPTTATEVPQSANLRSIIRAEKQLSKLELYAVNNDYESIKLALRNAPFSEVRKKSFAIIKEYADQPSKQEKLKVAYDAMIASIERLDNTAGLGMRGRKLPDDELLKTYQAASSSLTVWIAVINDVVATESA